MRFLSFLICAAVCCGNGGAVSQADSDTSSIPAAGNPADARYECFSPPVEIRGIWVDAKSMLNTARGVRDLVRRLHKANLNVLFPEVIARGYAVYPSKLLARDPRFVGAPDALAIMIREAHRLGMEVHPWVCIFRVGYTKDRGAILTAHPDWAELSSDGKELSPTGGLWLSPCVPAARDFMAGLFAELVRCYDIDGLHLDYIRYQNDSYGHGDASRALFKKQYGYDPSEVQPATISQYEWAKFRARQVNTFVQRIALQTRSIKPWVKISAAVGSEPKSARLGLMQNWANWVDNKWVDFLCPMAYSSKDDYFGRLMLREKEAVAGRTLLVPGIGFFQQKDPQQMVRQIGIARGLGAAGQVLFSSSYLKGPQSDALKTPYARPAMLPFRDVGASINSLCYERQRLAALGRQKELDYAARACADLVEYARYQCEKIRYVPPTELPLQITPYSDGGN